MSSHIKLCIVITIAFFQMGCSSTSQREQTNVLIENQDLEISATQGESGSDSIVIRFANRSTTRILINKKFLVYSYRDTFRIVAGRNIAPRMECFPNSIGDYYVLLEPMMARCIKCKLWPEQSDWYQVAKRYSGCMFVSRRTQYSCLSPSNRGLVLGRVVSYFKGTDEHPLDITAFGLIDMCWLCVPCSAADSSMRINTRFIYVPGDGPADLEKILRSSE